MSHTDFRVIINGGGPVGLLAAHLLTAAKIKYVILEKSSTVAAEGGACIFLQGSTLRVIEQLGFLEQLIALSTPMEFKEDRMIGGKTCRRTEVGSLWMNNHGYPCLYLPRKALVGFLRDSLQNHGETIRLNSNISDIKTGANGVRVFLNDGSVENGSIVLGCDGTYSHTLRTAQKLAQENGLQTQGLSTTRHIQTLYGYAPYPGRGEIGTLYEARSSPLGAQSCANAETVIFVLARRLPKARIERKHYTEEEKQEFVDAWRDKPIFADVTFGEIWKKSQWSILTDQETGFSDLWYHDRIVMAGDSVTSMESFAGMGFNIGAMHVVSLINGLEELIDREGSSPPTSSLTNVFETYRAQVEKPSRNAIDLTTKAVDGTTWPSWLSYMIDQYVFPLVGVRNIMHQVFSKDIIRYGQLVKFLPKEGTKTGAVAWHFDP
ncbi:FAD/NAD(P)-binding domain-containing protein [Pseudovirgaria hyperparasitica]|uniref:FAD/NAD(P)-binding domain-containing protein n=1 Tax=Pseudovirgaria hyperparasitica TaxID=470096 RepID=A0A6A6VUB7_9PEZI|nr:FAD/NAD(P)-binding domain-containing protein [Pseudovirgaria hyperparasitica]KAF2752841.1 FAD/NAD(P)-binding domain-containing protein [Pseudovirgaria hyperparasitica]